MFKVSSWASGSNNVARPDRLPENAARLIRNMNATPGGELVLRQGYEKRVGGENIRGAFAVGRQVVFVDGPRVRAYDTTTNALRELGTVTEVGQVAGAVHNGQLYFSTLQGSYRTNGEWLKRWDVPAPVFSVAAIAGALPAGVYKVAVTASGEDGEESGAEPVFITLDGKQALRVTTRDKRLLSLYCSAVNGKTLYRQGPLYGGGMAVTAVEDATQRLVTGGLVSPPNCEEWQSFHGVLVGRLENVLFFTVPMMPQVMDPVAGFVQYPVPVDLIAPTDGGVFVAADRTWFVTGLETGEVMQREVLELGAVRGSAVRLNDGSVAWFTRYGQAVGTADGQVALLNRDSYAPEIAERAGAGLVERDGVPVVVTTMRGVTRKSGLGTGDFAQLEC